MTGAPEFLVTEVEKLLRDVEDGVAKTRAAAPTEAERPTDRQAGDRRATRSCFDAVRRPRLTADIVANKMRWDLAREPDGCDAQLNQDEGGIDEQKKDCSIGGRKGKGKKKLPKPGSW